MLCFWGPPCMYLLLGCTPPKGLRVSFWLFLKFFFFFKLRIGERMERINYEAIKRPV